MTEPERQVVIIKLERALKESTAPFVDRVPRDVMLHLLESSRQLGTLIDELQKLHKSLGLGKEQR